MKIKWLGQAAFIVESINTLVIDPHNPMMGKMPADLTAAVVTVSHAHPDHNYLKGVGGQPQVFDQPGNFSAGGFALQGIATFHDSVQGKKRGGNVIFVIRAEEITLCHLGDLGHLLTAPQAAAIGPVDILMIPVGGFVTIGPTDAVALVTQLKPKLVLPMHYKAKKSWIPLPLAGVDKFTDALGWEVEEVDRLEVTSASLNSMRNHVVILRRQ